MGRVSWVTSALVVGLAVVVPSRAAAQPALLGAEVGAHYGFNFSNGDVDDHRVGVQGVLPLVGILEITPAVSFFTDFPGQPDLNGSAWQGFLAARVRPLGPATFLSVGYGVTAARFSVRFPPESLAGTGLLAKQSNTEWTDVGVIGVSFPGGLLRPFADLYMVDLLDRESAVGGVLLMGVNVGI